MPRVGIIGLLQESNTFIPARTTLAHFQRDMLCTGEEVRQRMAGTHHELGGFFAGLENSGIEAVPIFAARALPYGVIEAAAFDELLQQMLTAMRQAGPLEGMLVAPHGATVAENAPDADGFWLTKLREAVGPNLPIIGTFDLHANLSEAMTRACDALIGYRTNPHIDQRERGEEAAALMARTIRGEVRPVMAARFPPLVINIERQSTASEPCRGIYQLAEDQLKFPLVLSNSVALGFPYADVPEMGCAAVVVTDGDATIAGNFADDLAAALWAKREEFRGLLLSPKQAYERTLALGKRTCWLDMGDNVGAGSPGNSTVLLKKLQEAKLWPSFICLADAEAVKVCEVSGVGTDSALSVGQPALRIQAKVLSLHDGQFTEPNVRHGGISRFHQDRTAIVLTDAGVTVMLTTERMVPFSLNQLRSCGLDPASFQVLVAKGVHAPVAAYAEVCEEFIRVNTPGCTTADFTELTFQNRRRPHFPFETNIEYRPCPKSPSEKGEPTATA